jgi:hypothetical protein
VPKKCLEFAGEEGSHLCAQELSRILGNGGISFVPRKCLECGGRVAEPLYLVNA